MTTCKRYTDKERLDWIDKYAFDVHETNSVFGKWVCGIIDKRGLHISIYGKSPRAAIDAAIKAEGRGK